MSGPNSITLQENKYGKQACIYTRRSSSSATPVVSLPAWGVPPCPHGLQVGSAPGGLAVGAIRHGQVTWVGGGPPAALPRTKTSILGQALHPRSEGRRGVECVRTFLVKAVICGRKATKGRKGVE